MNASLPLSQRIAAVAGKLASGERAVADYLSEYPEEAAVSSAAQLGTTTGTSDATVIRTARKLGFAGLADLKRSLVDHVAHRRNPAKVLGERVRRLPEHGTTVPESVLYAGKVLFTETGRLLDHEAWQQCADALASAAHIWAYGIGPSATLAEYFALALRRSGITADAWTATGFRLADDLLRLRAHDAVVAIAPLRVFRETDTVLHKATDIGAHTVLLTEAYEAAHETGAQHVLYLPESTAGAANELLTPLALLHGLVLELTAKNEHAAIEHHERLNALRTEITGTELDTTNLREL